MRFEPRRAFSSFWPLPKPPQRYPALPSEIAFLLDYGIDRSLLDTAALAARRSGVCAERALIANGGVSEALYYRALAQHLGVAFESDWPRLTESVVAKDIVATGHVRLAGSAPRWLLAPTGPSLRLLLDARRRGLRLGDIAITTPSHLAAIVRLRCEPSIAYRARDALPDAAPTLSAKRVCRGWSPKVLVLIVAAAVAALFSATRGVANMFGMIFLASTIYRLIVSAFAFECVASKVALLDDAALPLYSVLVPLKDETDIVASLLAALERLDYPRAKLQILFLVEPEDAATRDALASLRLPAWCHVIVAPVDAGALRTKPRALNVGLQFARGDLITIYDAEDRPDPNQLRLAASHFKAAPETLACLQARLAVSNGSRGLLPHLFAIEYAALFDIFNVGTAHLGLPMALGGTSNHFRASALRAVGGWDSWNVTEDADLGLRLARFGFAIESLESTTYEDAPERLGAWLKQRRRWTKGWMQTLLVLARHPVETACQFGPARTVWILLLLTNLVTAPLLLPLFSLCVVYHLASVGLPTPDAWDTLLEATLAGSVVMLGTLATCWTGYVGARVRRIGGIAWSLPLLLPYQLLISLAAWYGLFDLLWKPFHWHKTAHGRAARRRR